MAREKSNKADEENITTKLIDIIQRYRKIIFAGFSVIVLILLGSIIAISVRDRLQARSLSQFDEFERRYFTLRSVESFDDDIERMTEVVILLEELAAFQRRSFGFASARAYSLSADIFWFLNDWEEAEKAWLAAARAARNSYLEPVSFFNAAVAAEERGDIDAALAHYTRVLALADSFPGAARAQFSIGRIEESRSNIEAAILAYRNLLARWPVDPLWANLAQSRIIALTN